MNYVHVEAARSIKNVAVNIGFLNCIFMQVFKQTSNGSNAVACLFLFLKVYVYLIVAVLY